LRALNAVLESLECQPYDAAVHIAHTQLDAATFAAAWAQGRAMSLNQAITEALSDEGSSHRGGA
jgi:hypothetical protein